MYPKVKVREEKNQDYEDVTVDHNIKIVSLSSHVSSSPEKEHQEVTTPFIPRIPVSCAATKVFTPAISARKETDKNDVKIDVKDWPNIRATPNLRPRAVLSSPDNDAVIGNKNRIKTERPTALRNRNSVQNRHSNAQCKVPSHINTQGQINTNLSNDTTTIYNKSELKGKKGSTMTVPSQRRYVRTGKSDPVKT